MKSIDYQAIGQTVKRLRQQHGLTQDQLSEKCEISTSFLGHIERGSRKLSLETAVKIADSLNVSIDTLIISGIESNDGLLANIDAIIQSHDKDKRAQFLRIVKVLG